MQRFISELHRRKVLRVAAAYVVGAWIVLQVALALQTAMSLAQQFSATMLALLVIGFFVAVGLSWFFEITPEGVKRTVPALGDASLVKPQTTDLALAGALMLVVIVALAQLLTSTSTTPSTPATTAEAVPARPEPPALGDKSIAVLPFANLSPDKGNEYFADGLTEELLNLLARIGDLKVISRTSAFAFKGKSTPLRDIAKQLGVRHILEGSVRAAGDDLRVVVQLIDASNDTHLWTQTYDRQVENVFALQQEMARDIAAALNVEIALSAGVDAAPTKSIEAYRLYLEGLNLVRGRDEATFPQARRLFERAIKADPKFAEAHVAMAKTYVARPGLPPPESLALARASAQAAIDLKPTLASAQALFGNLDRLEYKWESAIPRLESAVALDPTDSDARLWLGATQLWLGYIDAAIATLEDLRRTDPLFVLPSAWLMWARIAKGDDALAAKLAKELAVVPLFADVAHCELAIFAYDRGDASQAERHYRQSLSTAERKRPFVDAVIRALHGAEARPAALKAMGAEASRGIALFCAYRILRADDWLIAREEQATVRLRNTALLRLWAPRYREL